MKSIISPQKRNAMTRLQDYTDQDPLKIKQRFPYRFHGR